MQHIIQDTTIGVLLGAALRFILRRVGTYWLDSITDAMTAIFWEHAKAWARGLHTRLNPLKCEQCKPIFHDLP